ncbi:MAG TPA: hypothetical protein PKL83_01395 [bacterium]|nr:hypothetical protein [bacterium]
MKKNIVDLPNLVAELPHDIQELFARVFRVEKVIGRFADNQETDTALKKIFGTTQGYKEQDIVKVFNRLTYEGTLYNSVRARRPLKIALKEDDFKKALKSAKRDFDYVPEDVFGSVRGTHSFTSANIAKYDSMHSLVIFDDDNPLDFDRDEIRDYFDTAVQWFHKAHATVPEAIYPLFIWNCLWKSGGSIVHGHAQILLASDRHYARVDYLRHVSHEYEKKYVSNYFADLYRVHEALGLGLEHEHIRLMAYLTPLKEKELLIFTPKVDEVFTDFLYEVLHCYIHDIGVMSFNLAMAFPPFKHRDEEWGHFPVVVRIVDRGDPLSKISDIGAMELYAQSVVASDPFLVFEALHKRLQAKKSS